MHSGDERKTPEGRLLKSGWLEKFGVSVLGLSESKAQRRYCELAHGSLSYYKITDGNDKKRERRGVITLTPAAVVRADSTLSNTFFVTPSPNARVYHFVAETETECKEWVEQIRHACEAPLFASMDMGLGRVVAAGDESSQVWARTAAERLVDYFVVIGRGPAMKSDRSSEVGQVYRPVILQKMPEKDWPDCYIERSRLPELAFPAGVTLTLGPRIAKNSSKEGVPKPRLLRFVGMQVDGSFLFCAGLEVHEPLHVDEVVALLHEREGPIGIHAFGRNRLGKKGQRFKKLVKRLQMLRLLLGFASGAIYQPYILCLVSHHSYFSSMEQFLRALYRIHSSPSPVPIERFLTSFLYEVPVPLPGVAICHQIGETALKFESMDDQYPCAETNFLDMFRVLSVRSIIDIWTALVSEHSVIFSSRSWLLMAHVMEGFRSLLFPLKWQGIYVPRLPPSMETYLDAPVPYIIGINTALQEYTVDPEFGVLFVRLDDNEVFESKSYATLPLDLRRRMMKQLSRYESILKPPSELNGFIDTLDLAFPENEHRIKLQLFGDLPPRNSDTLSSSSASMRNITESEFSFDENHVRSVFFQVLVEILSGYQNYFNGSDMQYDRKKFVETKKPNQLFLQGVVDTQSFSQLLGETRLHMRGKPRAHIKLLLESFEKKNVDWSPTHSEHVWTLPVCADKLVPAREFYQYHRFPSLRADRMHPIRYVRPLFGAIQSAGSNEEDLAPAAYASSIRSIMDRSLTTASAPSEPSDNLVALFSTFMSSVSMHVSEEGDDPDDGFWFGAMLHGSLKPKAHHPVHEPRDLDVDLAQAPVMERDVSARERVDPSGSSQLTRLLKSFDDLVLCTKLADPTFLPGLQRLIKTIQISMVNPPRIPSRDTNVPWSPAAVRAGLERMIKTHSDQTINRLNTDQLYVGYTHLTLSKPPISQNMDYFETYAERVRQAQIDSFKDDFCFFDVFLEKRVVRPITDLTSESIKSADKLGYVKLTPFEINEAILGVEFGLSFQRSKGDLSNVTGIQFITLDAGGAKVPYGFEVRNEMTRLAKRGTVICLSHLNGPPLIDITYAQKFSAFSFVLPLGKEVGFSCFSSITTIMMGFRSILHELNRQYQMGTVDSSDLRPITNLVKTAAVLAYTFLSYDKALMPLALMSIKKLPARPLLDSGTAPVRKLVFALLNYLLQTLSQCAQQLVCWADPQLIQTYLEVLRDLHVDALDQVVPMTTICLLQANFILASTEELFLPSIALCANLLTVARHSVVVPEQKEDESPEMFCREFVMSMVHHALLCRSVLAHQREIYISPPHQQDASNLQANLVHVLGDCLPSVPIKIVQSAMHSPVHSPVLTSRSLDVVTIEEDGFSVLSDHNQTSGNKSMLLPLSGRAYGKTAVAAPLPPRPSSSDEKKASSTDLKKWASSRSAMRLRPPPPPTRAQGPAYRVMLRVNKYRLGLGNLERVISLNFADGTITISKEKNKSMKDTMFLRSELIMCKLIKGSSVVIKFQDKKWQREVTFASKQDCTTFLEQITTSFKIDTRVSRQSSDLGGIESYLEDSGLEFPPSLPTLTALPAHCREVRSDILEAQLAAILVLCSKVLAPIQAEDSSTKLKKCNVRGCLCEWAAEGNVKKCPTCGHKSKDHKELCRDARLQQYHAMFLLAFCLQVLADAEKLWIRKRKAHLALVASLVCAAVVGDGGEGRYSGREPVPIAMDTQLNPLWAQTFDRRLDATASLWKGYRFELRLSVGLALIHLCRQLTVPTFPLAAKMKIVACFNDSVLSDVQDILDVYWNYDCKSGASQLPILTIIVESLKSMIVPVLENDTNKNCQKMVVRMLAKIVDLVTTCVSQSEQAELIPPKSASQLRDRIDAATMLRQNYKASAISSLVGQEANAAGLNSRHTAILLVQTMLLPMNMDKRQKKLCLEYLLSPSNPLCNRVREEYAAELNYFGQDFCESLRSFLCDEFKPPTEPLKLKMILEPFATAFYRDNPRRFCNASVALTVSVAVCVLNSALHSKTPKPVSKTQFLAHTKSCLRDDESISATFLTRIYDWVATHPLRVSDDTVPVTPEVVGIAKKCQHALRRASFEAQGGWESAPRGIISSVFDLLAAQLSDAFKLLALSTSRASVCGVCTNAIEQILQTGGNRRPSTGNDHAEFRAMLNDTDGVVLFKKYSKQALDDENILFVIEERKYRKLVHQKQIQAALGLARSMVSTYVIPGSEKELNISGPFRKEIIDIFSLSSASSPISPEKKSSSSEPLPPPIILTGTEFDNALDEVLRILFRHSWPKFKKSKFFKEWMRTKESLSTTLTRAKERCELLELANQIRAAKSLVSEHRFRMRVYPQTIIGTELVDWLVLNGMTRELAIKKAEMLVRSAMLTPVSGDGESFGDNDRLFYLRDRSRDHSQIDVRLKEAKANGLVNMVLLNESGGEPESHVFKIYLLSDRLVAVAVTGDESLPVEILLDYGCRVEESQDAKSTAFTIVKPKGSVVLSTLDPDNLEDRNSWIAQLRSTIQSLKGKKTEH